MTTTRLVRERESPSPALRRTKIKVAKIKKMKIKSQDKKPRSKSRSSLSRPGEWTNPNWWRSLTPPLAAPSGQFELYWIVIVFITIIAVIVITILAEINNKHGGVRPPVRDNQGAPAAVWPIPIPGVPLSVMTDELIIRNLNENFLKRESEYLFGKLVSLLSRE